MQESCGNVSNICQDDKMDISNICGTVANKWHIRKEEWTSFKECDISGNNVVKLGIKKWHIFIYVSSLDNWDRDHVLGSRYNNEFDI